MELSAEDGGSNDTLSGESDLGAGAQSDIESVHASAPTGMWTASRIILSIALVVMTITATLTFALYNELSTEGHSPRAITGNWPCYVMYGSLAVFLVAGSIASCIRYRQFDPKNPFWDLLHPAASILMMGFFAGSMHFEPTDIHLWAPFASILGIAVSAGIKKIYDSADRKHLSVLRDFIFGGQGGNSAEEQELLDRGEPRVSGTRLG